MSAVLDAHLVVALDRFRLDLALRADDGEVVALLGPNGAGKTTALRAVAGLHALDEGHVTVDGTALDRPATDTFVPPDRRPVGLVFQDHLLFPHLSALDNVAFGLRVGGMPKHEARRTAAGWLDRLGLAEHAGARPRTLSGGQAQRVALARALATGPRVLLLDEPLAALDARARIDVRAELRRHLAGLPGARLLVTHDALDAVTLADRIVVVEDGRVSQEGTPAEVARRPRTPYVADLVGTNVVAATAVPGAREASTASGAALALGAPAPAAALTVVVPPAAVALHPTRPDPEPPNAWPVTVVGIEPDRARVRVRLDGPFPLLAEVTPAAVAELALAPGDALWASVAPASLDAYPA
jgi:molybdate transport system ATP-binding protein